MDVDEGGCSHFRSLPLAHLLLVQTLQATIVALVEFPRLGGGNPHPICCLQNVLGSHDGSLQHRGEANLREEIGLRIDELARALSEKKRSEGEGKAKAKRVRKTNERNENVEKFFLAFGLPSPPRLLLEIGERRPNQ